MIERAPSIFIGHTLPPMALLDDPYNSALINFGRNIDIKGIVCVSSQWISPGPIQVSGNPKPAIQHNFKGYQQELYNLNYKPSYSADLVQNVASLLNEHSFEVTNNNLYGLDYGIWMPLRLIYPEGNIPVVQISLPMYEDPRIIMKLGHALSPLRDEGILLMGSGSAAFNASKVIWHARGEDVHPKIEKFEAWLAEKLMSAKVEEILDYKSIPEAEFAHPTTASLLPLFFTMGSSMPGDFPQMIYRGFKYSTTSLLSFCLSDTQIINKSFS